MLIDNEYRVTDGVILCFVGLDEWAVGWRDRLVAGADGGQLMPRYVVRSKRVGSLRRIVKNMDVWVPSVTQGPEGACANLGISEHAANLVDRHADLGLCE